VLPDPLNVIETSMCAYTSGQLQAIDFLPASLGLHHLLCSGSESKWSGAGEDGHQLSGFMNNPGGSEVGSGGRMRAIKRNRTEAAALRQMCRGLLCAK